MSEKPKLAIIGAGASGLTLAWLLHEKFDVTCYERGETVGGNWCTIKVDEKVIEMGAVKVFEHNRYLRRLCELFGLNLTLDDVVPGGMTKIDDTFRIHYPHIKSTIVRLLCMGISFLYLFEFFFLFFVLRLASKVAHSFVCSIKLRHVYTLTLLRFFPRTIRDTVKAFLWMGALTFEGIDDSAFIGLMANVHNNFAGFGRHRIFNIDLGFQELARRLRKGAAESVKVTCGASVTRVKDVDGGLEVTANDESNVYEHVVFACPPWRAAEINEVEDCKEIRGWLADFVNAEDRVSLHDDEAIVGTTGIVQLTINEKAYFASLRVGVRNLWKSYQSYPTPERYVYPRAEHIEHEEVFDTDAFIATHHVPAFNSDKVQGRGNTWYIHNAYHPSMVRNGEQAVEQAMALCRRLCPESAQLAKLQVPPAPLAS